MMKIKNYINRNKTGEIQNGIYYIKLVNKSR